MRTVWSHTIKPKEVLKPLNEAEVRPSGFKGFFYLLKILVMPELFYYKSTNDFFLIESKKVGKSTHHYYECVYSNGLDEIILLQSVSKKIPTLISFKEMQRILSNDKNIETPEYFT